MGTVEERFWSNVVKGDGCWVYKNLGHRGYGKLLAKGKHVRAHRLAWELAKGPIPAGLRVCHSCDNPSCVKIDHLFLGTDADNTADMVAKGRVAKGDAVQPKNRARGERSNRTILKDDDIRRIRDLYASGRLSQQKIANSIGIHQAQVSRIVRNEAWAHIN
jgi:predicted XRE-type DNA-binding protein